MHGDIIRTMASKDNRPEPVDGLHQHAEKIARDRMVPSPKDICAMSPEEIRRMICDLKVYQIELEMQNTEFRLRQAELLHQWPD
jgi:hypothetical protein